MRYKDGKGDPLGFKVFLADNRLPQSLVIRYRGNRLHVLFKLAAVYVMYYDQIKVYLETRCLNTTPFRASLLADFIHPVAYIEMKTLAVLGKILTAPWMKKFYTKQGEQVHHMDAFNSIKECVHRIEQLVLQEKITLHQVTHNLFGEQLDKDKKDRIWKDNVDAKQFPQVMKAVLKATSEGLQKQYQTYESEQLEKNKDKLDSARTHNIDSEEVMGMFSASHSRAPRATLLYLSSKIKAKKNKTLQYLESHTEEHQEKLVKKSVPLAAKLKDTSKKSVIDLQKELFRRIAEKRESSK